MTNIISSSTNPIAVALQNSTVSSVTGDGTTYQAVFNSVVQGGNFNTSTGVFTCTIGGMFFFGIYPEYTSLNSSSTLCSNVLVTTQASYTFAKLNAGAYRSPAAVGDFCGYIIAPMAVNDTAFLTLQVSNTTKVVGFGSGVSFFTATRLF